MQVPHLRTIRERKLLTIRELATAAGVSPNTVFRIEQGRPAELRTIRKLAAALGVSGEELLGSRSLPSGGQPTERSEP